MGVGGGGVGRSQTINPVLRTSVMMFCWFRRAKKRGFFSCKGHSVIEKMRAIIVYIRKKRKKNIQKKICTLCEAIQKDTTSVDLLYVPNTNLFACGRNNSNRMDFCLPGRLVLAVVNMNNEPFLFRSLTIIRYQNKLKEN